MDKLPIVQSGIQESIHKSYERILFKESYLLKWWGDFKTDQGVMSENIMKELKEFKTPSEAAAFSHGIWMVYESLRSQLEADELNEHWGN